MEKMSPKKEQIILTVSAEIEEKLHEAARLYEIPATSIITAIVEEALPKWIQKYHVKQSLNKAAEKAKGATSPEEVLVKQDEIDRVMRLMSSHHDTLA
jgi:hypothetical protein